jgi:hypothetical protein
MRKVSISRFARAAVLAIAVCCATDCRTTLAANLVTNGGFETGDLTGWTASPNSGLPFVGASGTIGDLFNLVPYQGQYFGALGYNDGITGYGTVSQTVPTIPGDNYTFSFAYFVEPSNGNGPTELTATFGSQTAISLINDNSFTSDPITNDVNWATYSHVFTATSASTTISFYGINDPYYNGIDSVSVTFFSPEPSSVALLSLAGVGLVFTVRRRKAACAAAT